MANLNSAGRSYANSLVAQGKVNKTDSWSFSAADGDKLLGTNGDDWVNFGRAHLGVKSDEPNNTKAHWAYPVAKDGTLYRSGLIAARQRAGEQNDTEIFDAAGVLIAKIDGEGDDQGSEEPGEPGARSKILPFNRNRQTLPSGYRMAATGDAGEIYLYGSIGESWLSSGVSANQFRQDLGALGAVKQIDLHINSDGGDVFDGQAIYTLLNAHPASITVHIDGLAASAASFVAMAGNEIRIAEGGFMMIHDAWGVGIGNAADLRRTADLLDAVSGSIADIYAARTAIDVADIKKMMAEETWMSGADAVKSGFADVLVENKKIAASAFDLSRFKNLPTPLQPNRAAALSAIEKMSAALR